MDESNKMPQVHHEREEENKRVTRLHQKAIRLKYLSEEEMSLEQFRLQFEADKLAMQSTVMFVLGKVSNSKSTLDHTSSVKPVMSRSCQDCRSFAWLEWIRKPDSVDNANNKTNANELASWKQQMIDLLKPYEFQG
jgi:hypothetical protein